MTKRPRKKAKAPAVRRPRKKAALAKMAAIPDPFGYGQRAVNFLRGLKHPKSRLPDKAFQLDDWQEEIVRRIYGPCDENGNRIVRNVVILLPRGNRKTSLGAALSLLHTTGSEATPNGEVIFAAADQKQAKIGFRECEGIIAAGGYMWRKGQASRRFDAAQHVKLQESRNRILFPNGSWMEALSNDAGTQHGRTPVFALIDEIHAWKKRDLWDVIRTGLVKVPNSLSVVITTAGRGQDSIAFEVIDYARRVARGEIDDPSTLPILFETSADADWRDEAVWHAANPGLAHGYPDIAGLRMLAREAEHRPADRDAFRQLHLNVWLDYSEAPFVEMAVYDKGAATVDLDALAADREPCWLGVDLSSNNDLTAVVACWGDPENGYAVHPWFFCPADNLRRRAERDGVPYPTWAEEDHIIPTPGNVVDFRAVEDHIRDLCDRFAVQEVAFDPYMARTMMANLAEAGYPAVEMRQGWITMAPAIKELERAIVGVRFQHGAHPILRWHFSNIAIETDKAGNVSFHKGKSKDRIDGAVAAAMAVGRCAAGNSNRSSYDHASDDLEEWAYA
jgi:phage terminase large subunit-like protein